MMEGRLRFRNSMVDPLSPLPDALPQDAVQLPPHRVLSTENMTCVPHLPRFIVYAWWELQTINASQRAGKNDVGTKPEKGREDHHRG
jgi:hypothetical protein